MRAVASAVLTAAALLAAGCAKPPPVPRATWHRDVRPIAERRCQGCHVEGGIAPFSMRDFGAVKLEAELMAQYTASRKMPPWPPDEACGPPLRDARRLTQGEIDTIAAWAEDGAVEGDPKDAPAPLTAPEEFVGDIVVDPGFEYMPLDESDDYHCFPVDPGLTKAADVIGYDVRPGDRTTVHHVILYSIEDADDIATVDALDAQTPDVPGFTCFGGPGVDWAFTIAGWVPGSGATWFPDGVGVRIPASARLVVQVHYNQLDHRSLPDRTVVELATSPIDVDRAYIIPVPDLDFVVPAGEVKTTSVSYDVPVGGTVYGVIPHMHLLGTEIKAEIVRAGGGGTECVNRIPKWDFHWQQFYFFTEPIAVAEGDALKISCTFDNTAAHQPIVHGERLQPRTVSWGEKTTDEMCLVYFMASAGGTPPGP